MTPKAFRRSALRVTLAVALAASIVVTGCSDSSNTSVPGQLELAVSSGYPILGATVTLKGSNGATLQVVDTAKTGSVTIPRSEALGVLGFGPYLAQSTGGTANGVPVTESYFSIASSDAGRTNITPITHLIAVEATGSATTDGIKKLFTSGFDSTKAQQLTSTKLAAAKTSVGATLNLLNSNINFKNYDPLTASFKFGDAIDSQLDYLALVRKNTSLDGIQEAVAKTAKGDTPDVKSIQPFKRVIAFGDSLTDGGAYTVWASYAASGQQLFNPASPFTSLESASKWGGKFTTNPGKVWVEYLADFYGYAIKPAMLMGGGQASAYLLNPVSCPTCTNYAQGGSRVLLQPGIGNKGTSGGETDYDRTKNFTAASSIPVKEQIDIHLGTQGEGKFKAGDLVFVLAGANDIFVHADSPASADEKQAAIYKTALALAGEAVRLKQANATALVVIGLPDMGKTPAGAARGSAVADALSALSRQVFNVTLATELKKNNILFIDPNEILGDVLAKPADYGFKVTTGGTACGVNQIATKTVLDDPNNPSSLYCSVPNAAVSNSGTLRTPGADTTYMFADSVHPSSQAHKVLAEFLGRKLPRLLSDGM